MTQTPPTPEPATPITISHVFGEITWLFSQSIMHRELRIGDLEWLVMPAILSSQFYIFRDGSQPVGVALWASLNAAAEKKLDEPMLEAETRLKPEDWTSGSKTWLIDLVAPFASDENRHREIMIADLISGPLKGKRFSLHRTDPDTGKREAVAIDADAGDKLKDAILKAAEALGTSDNKTRH